MDKLILLIFFPVMLMGASGPGYLLLNNGVSLEGQLEFDEYEHLVTIHLQDSSYSMNSSQVNRFEFTDSKSLIRRIFLGSSLQGLQHQTQFFELLLTGTITLLRTKSREPTEWTINHPKHFQQDLIPESYRYFILVNDRLTKIRNFKKSLSKVMKQHWKTAWEYGRQQARQRHRVVAYIMAIDFYNLLVDPKYPGVQSGYEMAVMDFGVPIAS